MSVFVFISYSRVDSRQVDLLTAVFDELNVEYFLDKKEIKWGQPVDAEIGSAISRCSHFLVVISPASIESPWVPYEVGHAKALGKTLLPFLTHPRMNVPAFLAELQYIHDIEKVRDYFSTLLPASELKSGHSLASGESLQETTETPGIEENKPHAESALGIEGHRDRSGARVAERLRCARVRIDILTIEADRFREEIALQVEAALQAAPDLKVRILMLDPESTSVAARSEQLGVPRRDFREEMRQQIEKSIAILGEYQGRVVIRFYDAFPSQEYYLIDDTIVLSIATLGRRSSAGLHLTMDVRQPSARDSLLIHFESLWAMARVST